MAAHYGSDRKGAEEACGAIPEGRKCLIQADLGDLGETEALWKEAVGWRGRIDVVVLVDVERPVRELQLLGRLRVRPEALPVDRVLGERRRRALDAAAGEQRRERGGPAAGEQAVGSTM